MGYGMGYGLASYRQLLAAVSTERFAILLATTDEREFLALGCKLLEDAAQKDRQGMLGREPGKGCSHACICRHEA
jgi:hypothetical protein